MNVKKKINEGHRDYPAYLAECRSISEMYTQKEELARNKYPEWKGMGHPAGDEIYKIKKQFHLELKNLMRKYEHLFTEVVDE